MHRTHLTSMVSDLAVFVRDVEVKPRMWIDQIHARELGLEFDRLVKCVFRAAVMGENRSRPEKKQNEKSNSTHGGSSSFELATILSRNVHPSLGISRSHG